MSKKRLPKPHRPNSGIEYKLLVEPYVNAVAKRSGIVFLFRTSEEFQNFVYELVVESRRENDRLFFNIIGLRTPLSDFPRPGPAVCRCEFDDLTPGEYTLLIDRRGKQINQFKISIKKKITVLRSARQGKFIDLVTTEADWSVMGN